MAKKALRPARRAEAQFLHTASQRGKELIGGFFARPIKRFGADIPPLHGISRQFHRP
jgi:hypothetical protein